MSRPEPAMVNAKSCLMAWKVHGASGGGDGTLPARAAPEVQLGATNHAVPRPFRWQAAPVGLGRNET